MLFLLSLLTRPGGQQRLLLSCKRRPAASNASTAAGTTKSLADLLVPSEHLETAAPECPTTGVCVTCSTKSPIFASSLVLSRVIACKGGGLRGTFLPCQPHPSPEGLHQIEVGELMQIHEGVQHGQVQLFPGRTGTGTQKRRLGRWEWTQSWGGHHSAPSAGLAPGQGAQNMLWGRSSVLRALVWLTLCTEKCSQHVLRLLSPLSSSPGSSDVQRWPPNPHMSTKRSPQCQMSPVTTHRSCPQMVPTYRRFLDISSHIPRQSPRTSDVQKVPNTLDPHTLPKRPDTQSPVHLGRSDAHRWS